MFGHRPCVMSAAALTIAASVGLSQHALAADQVVKVGIELPLTGFVAQGAERIKDAAVLAFEEANASHAVPGTRIEVFVLNDSTSTTGGPDPAQAATNARKMVSDESVVAAIGPQTSGSGKAMAPILSQGGLATITPSATNPDLTDPKLAAQFRPGGKPIFFRTCTTDAYQGPGLANYFAATLSVKSVYVLDDGDAFGIGIADSFQAQADKKGIKVYGRDRLDAKAGDYSIVLTKIKQLNPDALYFGGLNLAGVKLVKQAYEIIPGVIKGSGDGIAGPDLLAGAGFPAVEGWYVTIPSAKLVGSAKTEGFVGRFQTRFGTAPIEGSILAYDAAHVIIDAMQRIAATGTRITREAMRDAIQSAKVDTLQGVVSFDQDGDIQDRTISVFQIRKDATKPLDDFDAQYKYIGSAPQS
jgi:branched-chain amino acid transport system substrate-binding protein